MQLVKKWLLFKARWFGCNHKWNSDKAEPIGQIRVCLNCDVICYSRREGPGGAIEWWPAYYLGKYDRVLTSVREGRGEITHNVVVQRDGTISAEDAAKMARNIAISGMRLTDPSINI